MSSNFVANRRQFSLGAAAGALVAAPFISNRALAQNPEFRLVFAHTFSQASEKFVVTGISLFKELAEKYSKGRLLVDVHDSGRLGGQGVLPQKVLAGSIQGCQLSMQNFTPHSEVYNLLDMPYVFPTSESFERALESSWFEGSRFQTEPSQKGFRVLPGMWSNAGYRVLGIGKRRPREVRVPADLKGVKVRVNPARVEQQAFALTPANQATIDWGEAYQAIQQGVADGLNVGIGPITATRIHEVLSSATLINMTFNGHITVLSKAWYDKLPADMREAVDRAARDSWSYQKTEQRKANTEMLALWRSTGMKVIELSADERKQWVDTTGHTRAEWEPLKEKYGRAEYAKLVELGKA